MRSQKSLLFKLFLNDVFVGYESWDSTMRWNYSQPNALGARGWSSQYIPHNKKVEIKEIIEPEDEIRWAGDYLGEGMTGLGGPSGPIGTKIDSPTGPLYDNKCGFIDCPACYPQPDRKKMAESLIKKVRDAWTPDETPTLKIGDTVIKVGGDYTFEGKVVSVFKKLSGKVRIVAEDDRGILHVFSEKNLKKA